MNLLAPRRPAIAARRSRGPEVESLEGRTLMASGLTRFPVPLAPHEQIEHLTRGADGNFWFDELGSQPRADLPGSSEFDSTAIGKIAPGGAVSLAPLPAGVGMVQSLTPLADGTAWFTSLVPPSATLPLLSGADHIGRIDPDGAVHVFDVPDGVFNAGASLIPGADGNLWFIGGDTLAHFAKTGSPDRSLQVARINPRGVIQDIISLADIPGTASDVNLNLDAVLKAGPDGALWFGEDGMTSGALVRIDTRTGQARAFALSSSPRPYQYPGDFAITADGSVWFEEVITATGSSSAKTVLDRLSPSGDIARVALPGGPHVQPGGTVLADADGGVRVMGYGKSPSSFLAIVNADGGGTRIRLASRPLQLVTLLPAADGALFFESSNGPLGRVTASGKVRTIPRPKPLTRAIMHRGPSSLKVGPDGDIWFINSNGRAIDRFAPSSRASRSK